jgi:hypothetical protein
MRLALAFVVVCIVAACAIQQSSSGLGFVRSDGARSAQAALDAEAILQGMARARNASERLAARDVHPNDRGTAPPAVAR